MRKICGNSSCSDRGAGVQCKNCIDLDTLSAKERKALLARLRSELDTLRNQSVGNVIFSADFLQN